MNMDIIQPKISLIIPVYNIEKYIGKCIESVINQTYKNLEIIIINDGSSDKSLSICNFYANMDNRIIIINQNNQGLSAARNNAMDIVSGEYIGFIDGDDRISLNMYEILYKNMKEYNAEISMCNFICIHEDGGITPPKSNFNVDSMFVLDSYEKIKKIIYHNNFFVWNKLYKTDLFKEMRFPVGIIYEDAFVIPNIIDKAKRLVICPDNLYYYVSRDDSITHVQFTPARFNMVMACIKVYEYAISIPSMEDEIEKICRNRMFASLFYCIIAAIKTNKIDSCIQEIEEIITAVKKYDIYECNLGSSMEKTIKFIFEDIKKFICIYRYSNNNILNI